MEGLAAAYNNLGVGDHVGIGMPDEGGGGGGGGVNSHLKEGGGTRPSSLTIHLYIPKYAVISPTEEGEKEMSRRLLGGRVEQERDCSDGRVCDATHRKKKLQ